jgi:hypothetical protein
MIILPWRLGWRLRGSIFYLIAYLLLNTIHQLLSLAVFVSLRLM